MPINKALAANNRQQAQRAATRKPPGNPFNLAASLEGGPPRFRASGPGRVAAYSLTRGGKVSDKLLVTGIKSTDTKRETRGIPRLSLFLVSPLASCLFPRCLFYLSSFI